jgi:hypothetical protein
MGALIDASGLTCVAAVANELVHNKALRPMISVEAGSGGMRADATVAGYERRNHAYSRLIRAWERAIPAEVT